MMHTRIGLRPSCRAPVILLALLCGSAMGLAQSEIEPPTYPATPEELLARMKPLPARLKGWTMAPDPQTAAGQAASTLLPPEVAPVVLSYHFDWGVRLQLIPETPHDPVVVEVLRFTDPLDAFGAFAHFRTPTSEAANLKAISYWTGTQHHVWRDTFYVRTTPPPTATPARATAEAAAEAVMSVLPLPGPLPLMMRLMPEARQVTNSLRYYRRDLLANPALGDGLVADYLENGTQLQLALLRYGTDEAARQAYREVAVLLAPGGGGTPLALLGRQAQTITSEQFGLTYLVQESRYLILALGVHDPDTAEGLLRITATSIRIVR